jgi:hypothetical protein
MSRGSREQRDEIFEIKNHRARERSEIFERRKFSIEKPSESRREFINDIERIEQSTNSALQCITSQIQTLKSIATQVSSSFLATQKSTRKLKAKAVK